MKLLIRFFFATVLGLHIAFANAQSGDLNLNGIAAFEQLRKEYYIGALYLGWPGPDAATISNMPGKKRMDIHITADRWPALRFSQIWNQLITINNPLATINANAMDIVAFTSIPKGDLVEGDQLSIELTANNTTQISLNGLIALRTGSPVLFDMLLNTWIGLRPPNSEFKRDMLAAPKDKAGTELLARFNSIHPNDSRKKVIAGWGIKPEVEQAVSSTTTVAAAAPRPAATQPAATPPPTPIKKPEPVAIAAKPQAEKQPVLPAAAPIVAETPVATTTPVATDPAIEVAQQKQKTLRADYIAQIRRLVVKNIDYPKRAIKENIEGLVMVKVQVDREGNLTGFQIIQPADDLLDAAAARAAERAAPFPKASIDLEGSIFETLIPIVFKLTQ